MKHTRPAVLAAGLLLATSGCNAAATTATKVRTAVASTRATTASTSAGAMAGRTITARDRTDIAPVTRRIPAVPASSTVLWFAGESGVSSSRIQAPGPTDTWLQVVADLSAVERSRVATTCAATSGEEPSVIPELAAHLQGGWKRCAATSKLFAPGWVGRAWLSDDGTRLVVNASST